MDSSDKLTGWICGLMREDYWALGFIPDTTIKNRYVQNDRYIIQYDNRGRKVGYLLHGAIKYGRATHITQVAIDYDKRMRGFAHQAVRELERRCLRVGSHLIRLRCAEDLDAVKFWQSEGFAVKSVVPGKKGEKRMIVNFEKEVVLDNSVFKIIGGHPPP